MPSIQLPLSIRETESSNTQERKILIPSTPHKSHRLYTHTPSNPANPHPTLRVTLQKLTYCSELLNRHFSTSFWEWEGKCGNKRMRDTTWPLGNSQVHARAHRCMPRPTGAEQLFLGHSIPNAPAS